MELLPSLLTYVEARTEEFDNILAERRKDLERLADYISQRAQSGVQVDLTFVCTHNSRRSHLAQLWARVGACYYGIKGVNTYSGGTEVTAFNPRAVEALKRCGMEITSKNTAHSNPRYVVRISKNGPTAECFSKRFDVPSNPQSDYAAVMTCSQADKECPLVQGCDLRIAISYEDPKKGDGTPVETQLYDERCQQIAREMLYAFSKVRVKSSSLYSVE